MCVCRGREANTDRFSLGAIQIICDTLRGAGGIDKVTHRLFSISKHWILEVKTFVWQADKASKASLKIKLGLKISDKQTEKCHTGVVEVGKVLKSVTDFLNVLLIRTQAPDWARPLRNFPMAWKSMPSEQLKTTHCLATALAKSLHVSVLPAPEWQKCYLF